jgi:divalent metal cation (Fe/Co/Zn/Cd) transporter
VQTGRRKRRAFFADHWSACSPPISELGHTTYCTAQVARGSDPRGPTHENEPHAFTVRVSLITAAMSMSSNLAEHEHADRAAHRDNNMRAAIIHVMADAAVSVIVIVGLSLGGPLGWQWMDLSRA